MPTENTTNGSPSPQPTLDQLTGPQPIGHHPNLDELTAQRSSVAPQAAQQPTPAHQPAPVPSPVQQTASEATVDPTAVHQPAVYRQGKDLVLVHGASLLSNYCIKTGKPAKTLLSIGLRSPFRPASWFKSEKVTIGLSSQGLENFRINQALSFTLMVLGAIMIPVGFMSGIITSLVGLLVCAAGFIVRSIAPIWTATPKDHTVTIKGCGEKYLKQFPEGS